MREAVGPGAATRSRFRVPYVPTLGSGLAYIGPMQQAYRELLETFGRGWERGAVDEIASVFASDAVFRETPFTEPSTGLEAIRRSEEHTSELQSRGHLVCRLLLEKKNH